MKNITVIGAGTMGNGIAHIFAQSGFDVTLVDISDAALQKALATIGKNLDRAELTKSFEACKATPEAEEARKKALRFQVGSRVECNTGGGSWSPGRVVALMYRDDGMPSGMVAPYQVQLDNGDLIYAPADEAEVIRKG